MIYFFHGTDIDKIKEKANGLVSSLLKKKPDASFFKIDTDNFDKTKFEEYIGGQGLFVNKYIVLADRLCSDKEIKEILIDNLKEIKESGNIFIIIESKLDKSTLTKIEKKSEKTLTFEIEKEIKQGQEDNVFEIANMFGRKDKKGVWIWYRKLIDKGIAPEEIHGIIFWKIKTMILSGGNNLWKEKELYFILDKMIEIYHEARRGKYELEIGLEELLIQNI